MTITIHYPIGNTVYRAEAEITPSGSFMKKRETEQPVAKLGSTDEAFSFCEKIVGKRLKIASGVS